jgi:cation diffusion facilitator CzcD-associated flavoprotein CzcO
MRSPRQRGRAPRVAVIGAGFGGIATAVKLQRAGIREFTVFEKADGPGGVWRHNTYPGAEVDTPSHWYSFSFKRFDWSRTHSQQRELEQYMVDTIAEFSLAGHFRFGTAVTAAVWNEERQAYAVTLEGGETQEFEVVISAVGLFNVPQYPSWPGMDEFAGPLMHSARWDTDVDLAGKDVAIVGTGSSGTQIVRALAPVVRRLYVFQRDPGWVMTKGDRDLTAEERRRRANPVYHRYSRIRTFVLEQKRFWGGRETRPDTPQNHAAQRQHEEYIAEVFKDRPDLAAAVTPNHPYFGKRPVKASGYYEALLRENVVFVPRAISRLTESSIVDAEGEERRVDAVALATGYKAAEFLGEIDLVGRKGRSIHDVWAGEPEAFLGLTVPGFPNFYMLYGPNTNMGMIVFNLEAQANYAVRDIKRMRRTGATAIEVRPSIHRLYNRWLQKRLSKTVWVTTNNYFKSASGKVVVQFPTAMVVYWALTRLLRRISAVDRTVAVRDEPFVPPVAASVPDAVPEAPVRDAVAAAADDGDA